MTAFVPVVVTDRSGVSPLGRAGMRSTEADYGRPATVPAMGIRS